MSYLASNWGYTSIALLEPVEITSHWGYAAVTLFDPTILASDWGYVSVELTDSRPIIVFQGDSANKIYMGTDRIRKIYVGGEVVWEE